MDCAFSEIVARGMVNEEQMAAWRDARRRELARLPKSVEQAAYVYENGEVSWSNEHAEEAVNALADAGFLITGLDARKHFPDGSVMETSISDYSPGLFHSKERGLYRGDAPRAEAEPNTRRELALRDLQFAAEHGEYVLITYSPPEDPQDVKIG